MKYLRKRVDHPLEILETNEQYSSNCARKDLKDAYLERIYIDGYEFIMFADENGKFKNLPLNFFMRFTEKDTPISIQPIVGDVVFIRCKPCDPCVEEIFDYEVDEITQEDISYVQSMIEKANQDKLYFDYTCQMIKYNQIDFNNLKSFYDDRDDL